MGGCISVIYMTLSCLADKVLSGPWQSDWVSWTAWTVQRHPGKQQTLKLLLNNCVSKCSIISKHDCSSFWLKMFTVAKLFSESVVSIDPGAPDTMCLWEVNNSMGKKQNKPKQNKKVKLYWLLSYIKSSELGPSPKMTDWGKKDARLTLLHRSALEGQTQAQTRKKKAQVSSLWVSLCPRPWEKPTGQYWSSIATEGKDWWLNKADVLCVRRQVDATPSRCNAFSQQDRVTALCRVSLEQRSTYSLHQQKKPKNSGRDGRNTGTEHIINPGDCSQISRTAWTLRRCMQLALHMQRQRQRWLRTQLTFS